MDHRCRTIALWPSALKKKGLYYRVSVVCPVIVDQFAPQRKATPKEKRLRLKPWTSRGLFKSIQTKNRLFKQLQKKREDSVPKNKYKVKIYRNTLNRALKWAKSNHYLSVLEEHKGDSKKMWEIVNELTDNKKRSRTLPSKLINRDGTVITNHQTIADEFNKYFINVRKSMADSIAPRSLTKSYSNSCVWSSNKASNSIFLYPHVVRKKCRLQWNCKFENKKATRTSDIETKFIKYAYPVNIQICEWSFQLLPKRRCVSWFAKSSRSDSYFQKRWARQNHKLPSKITSLPS